MAWGSGILDVEIWFFLFSSILDHLFVPQYSVFVLTSSFSPLALLHCDLEDNIRLVVGVYLPVCTLFFSRLLVWVVWTLAMNLFYSYSIRNFLLATVWKMIRHERIPGMCKTVTSVHTLECVILSSTLPSVGRCSCIWHQLWSPLTEACTSVGHGSTHSCSSEPWPHLGWDPMALGLPWPGLLGLILWDWSLASSAPLRRQCCPWQGTGVLSGRSGHSSHCTWNLQYSRKRETCLQG